MALKKRLIKTITGFDGELIANDAYFKVSSISGGKNGLSALVTGVVAGNQVYAQEHFFEPNLNGENFIKQAYEHIKTLEEFADAEDC